MKKPRLHRTTRGTLVHSIRVSPQILALACSLAVIHAFAGETNAPTVLFDRDIKPIFEQSCLRCHGGERPKSGLRLTDRESALKGGSNHPDSLVPGDSSASKLLQFVSGQPEDMQMPPEGKGDPLTSGQIELLRQWIDAGAVWGEPPKPVSDFSISPTARWVGVSGDDNKFREIEGINPGWAGGIEHFSLTEAVDKDTMLRAEGHYLYDEHDGAFKLSLDRREVGFVHLGLEQWRSYYDDTGGYYPLSSPPSQDLGRELALDHGRAWVDLGLTLPEWPRLVLGYEFRYRDGDKSTLQWGLVGDRNTYPSAKAIDEELHIIKFDISYQVAGWELEDNARVEFYDLSTSRDNALLYSTGPNPDILERALEKTSSVQGMNTFRAEKQLREWWLLSAGYLFSKYDGTSRINQTTLNYNYLPVSGQFWSSDDLVLNRASQVVSAANLFQPIEGLTASLSMQGEWIRQEGAGDVSLDSGPPQIPDEFILRPARVSSNHDRWRTSENVNVRFTKIPWTVVYGETRLDQERTSQFESLAPDPGVEEMHDGFLRDTDIVADRIDWRAGFNTSPQAWLSFGGGFRRNATDNDYDNKRDFLNETNGLYADGEGYSAFIRGQEIYSDTMEARIVLRPLNWLKTALTYERVTSEFKTSTDPVATLTNVPGGGLIAANYDADVYGASVTVTPWQRLYLTATFSYSDTRTVSADNDNPAVVPYEGDVYSVLANARFVVNERTDLFAAYGYSKAGYGQSNYADGLPLGIEFTRQSLSAGFSRKLSEACTVSLRYAYYNYVEPSSGGVNDYSAHGVFATLNYRWQ